jgi:hypothetical protein
MTWDEAPTRSPTVGSATFSDLPLAPFSSCAHGYGGVLRVLEAWSVMTVACVHLYRCAASAPRQVLRDGFLYLAFFDAVCSLSVVTMHDQLHGQMTSTAWAHAGHAANAQCCSFLVACRQTAQVRCRRCAEHGTRPGRAAIRICLLRMVRDASTPCWLVACMIQLSLCK